MKYRHLLILLTGLTAVSGAQAQPTRYPGVPDTTARVTPISLPELTPPDSGRNYHWHELTQLDLGVTQSFATNNWGGSPSNSVTWISDFAFHLGKLITRRWTLDNDLRMAYGQSHYYDLKAQRWAPPQIAANRIRHDSIFRRFGHALDPYVAGSAESQFVDKTYQRPLYLNPAELTESAGVAHYLFNQPLVRIVRTRVGLGLRERFIQSVDSLRPRHTDFLTVIDAGGEWVTDMELGSPMTRFSYVTKLILFQAFYNSRAARTDKRWQSVDVDWDNVFRVSVTRVIQVALSWQLLYDQEVTNSIRFREYLTLSASLRHAS